MFDTLLDFISITAAGETLPGEAVPDEVVYRKFADGKAKGRTGLGKLSPEDLTSRGKLIVGHGKLSSDPSFIDTEFLSRILVPTLPIYNLDEVCRWFKIPEKGDRSLRTGRLYLALLDYASSFVAGTLRLLGDLLLSSGEYALASLFNSLEPASNKVSGRSVDRNTEDILAGISQVPRPSVNRGIEVTESDILDILGSNGTLSSLMKDFEERPEQLETAAAVMKTVNEGKVLLAEAGTGTGKSYAYLVPAVFWAVLNEKRVIVSTNTKNLQEQLFDKDLPIIKQAFPYPFRYSLLKGRQNYLCRARLDDSVDPGVLIQDEQNAVGLLHLIAWSKQTVTGDIAENRVFDQSKHSNLWKKVNCDARSCPQREGPRDCFLSRARESAQDSHVVVVNHALLLNDTSMDSAILGDYECLVIDEAHNLEKVAFDQFGKSISYFDFRQFFEKHFGNGNRRTLHLALSEEGQKSLARLPEKAKACRGKLERFFKSLNDLVSREGVSSSFKKRYLPGENKTSTLSERAETSIRDLRQVKAVLGRILYEYSGGEVNEEHSSRKALREVSGAIEELTELTETLDFLTDPPTGDWVYWMQGEAPNARKGFVSLKGCPIEMAPLFKEFIYDTKRAVVLSSATMSIAGNFSFLSKILGTDLLDPGRVETLQGGTSFPLERQVLFALPTFLPSVLTGEFIEQLPFFLNSVVGVVPGGTLVLFTSRELLRRTYVALKPLLEKEGLSCLAQDEDGSRESLIDRFRLEERSVLLGTDSFWEGVDVPGESLQLVVIVRLPFLVPTDPVTEAISERMTRVGENPFTDYSLPRAAIRLKQGFGRLIRSRKDTGAVLVLDKRIVEKRYGAYLQRAMPVEPMVMNDIGDLLTVLDRWCDSARSGGSIRVAPIDLID